MRNTLKHHAKHKKHHSKFCTDVGIKCDITARTPLTREKEQQKKAKLASVMGERDPRREARRPMQDPNTRGWRQQVCGNATCRSQPRSCCEHLHCATRWNNGVLRRHVDFSTIRFFFHPQLQAFAQPRGLSWESALVTSSSLGARCLRTHSLFLLLGVTGIDGVRGRVSFLSLLCLWSVDTCSITPFVPASAHQREDVWLGVQHQVTSKLHSSRNLPLEPTCTSATTCPH